MRMFHGHGRLLRRTLPQASGKWFMIAVCGCEGGCCRLRLKRVAIEVECDLVADGVCVDGLRWDVGM